MADWNTDSSEENPKQEDTKNSKPANKWDDESSDEEPTEPQKPAQNNTKKNPKKFDDSSSDENDSQKPIEHQKDPPKKKKVIVNDKNLFDETITKNNKKTTKKSKRIIKKVEKDDSSSDSSDENTKKNDGVKRDFKTDNDHLFNGLNNNKKETNNKKEDKREMLSGKVKLNDFPLGSTHDMKNLAKELSNVLQQRIFDEHINGNDIFVFFESLLNDRNLTDPLDMVDAKSLVQITNKILNDKQKEFRKAKNVKKKKKNKPTIGKKWEPEAKKKSGNFVQGGYNSDEFDAFD